MPISPFRDVFTSLVAAALLLCSAVLLPAGELGAQKEGKAALSERPDQDTGWQSGGNYPLIGSPDALRTVKDRPLKMWWSAFPPTLRTDGPNSNLTQTATIHGLIYETLVGIHPNTEEFLPSLAKEWRIETDFEKGKQTFWFRIDERARFSDGEPVLAKDVYASWWHLIQPDRKDPSNVLVYGQFEEPVIVDERTIKVTTKELNWRLFLYFGGAIKVFPEKYIKIPGDKYLDEYNWKFIPGSGPYVMDADRLDKGVSLTMRRRNDWWAENERWAQGTYNFEEIKFVVVTDQELYYQKFRADEFDHYRVSKAQRWVEELPDEEVIKKGWIKMRKIYNEAPEGFSGFVFNMREKPFDDKRVRLAWAHLFNRERLIEKLFFKEYAMIDSYFPGRDWGNGPNNPKIRFDPYRAEELLWDAGFKERDAQGYLIGPDGKRFTITLTYGTQSWDRIWNVVKQDYEDAGIEFKLELIDPAQLVKKIQEHQFKVYYQSWGALLFPNPRTSWSSELADHKYNNNLSGFKNAEVDKLLKEYDVTFDRERQKEITRKIDELVFKEHPYALGWFANHERVLYWDRFGHPEKYWSRTGQVPEQQIIAYWWYDPQKIERLKAARKAGQPLEQGQIEHWPWLQPNK